MSDTVTRLLEVAKRPVNPREYVQLAYLGDVSLEDLDGEALEELFDACIDVEKKKKPASAWTETGLVVTPEMKEAAPSP